MYRGAWVLKMMGYDTNKWKEPAYNILDCILHKTKNMNTSILKKDLSSRFMNSEIVEINGLSMTRTQWSTLQKCVNACFDSRRAYNDPESTCDDRRNTHYDSRSTSDNRRSTWYDRRSTSGNRRRTCNERRRTSDNRRSTGYDRRSMSHNRRSTG